MTALTEGEDSTETDYAEEEGNFIDTTVDTIDGVVEAGLNTPVIIYKGIKALFRQIFIDGYLKIIKNKINKKNEKKAKKIKKVRRIKKSKNQPSK